MSRSSYQSEVTGSTETWGHSDGFNTQVLLRYAKWQQGGALI
jgi:hypothetical protein